MDKQIWMGKFLGKFDFVSQTRRKQIWMGKSLVLSFIIPLAIYLATLLPTVGFWDTGEFQTIPYTFDIGHPTGYPTYVLVGKVFLTIFPFGEVAWRMNFLSALSVSLGIYFFALLIKKATQNTILAIGVSLFLSVNPYLWPVAITADPHALHFLFTSIFLFLAFELYSNKRPQLLLIITFIVGISLGNHLLSIFFLPSLLVLSVYLIKSLGIKRVYKYLLLSGVLLGLGSLVYLLLPLIYLAKPPLLNIDYSLASFEGFKRHVLGEDFQGLMKTWARENPRDTLNFYFSLISQSFPFLSWVFVIFGFLVNVYRKESFGLVLFFTFFLTSLFAITYQNAVIERYFIASFAIATIWTTELVDFIQKKTKIVYIEILIIGLFVQNLLTNYKKIDQSENYTAYSWAKESLRNIDEGGVIFSWWSYSTPLWYFQKVQGERNDVTIINAPQKDWENKAKAYLKTSPVYFIEKIGLNDQKLRLVPKGNIYKLTRN